MNSSDFGTLGAYFELEATTNRIKELEKQLAEKDKEIEMLKEDCNASIKIVKEVQEQLTRYQVCEEIRKKLKAHCDYSTENGGWHIPEYKIDILLDQIEKGE